VSIALRRIVISCESQPRDNVGEREYARRNGKSEIGFCWSRPQVTEGGYRRSVLWMAFGCGSLQLAGLCGSWSADTIESGSGGGAAGCSGNTEQTAAAFYNGDGPATVAG
jgi:hypothetical protein